MNKSSNEGVLSDKDINFFLFILTIISILLFSVLSQFYIIQHGWITALGILGLSIGILTKILVNSNSYPSFGITKNLSSIGIEDINSARVIFYVTANNLCFLSIMEFLTKFYMDVIHDFFAIGILNDELQLLLDEHFKHGVPIIIGLSVGVSTLIMLYDNFKNRRKAIKIFWKYYNNDFNKSRAVQLANKSAGEAYLSFNENSGA